MNVLKHASHIQHILDRLPKSTVWALNADNVSGFSLVLIAGDQPEAERIAHMLGPHKYEDFPGGIEIRFNPVLTVSIIYGKEYHERPARKVEQPSFTPNAEPCNRKHCSCSRAGTCSGYNSRPESGG